MRTLFTPSPPPQFSYPSATQPLRSDKLSDIVPEWDANYINCEQELLFELILAANFMDIKSLMDLSCAKVASMIKNKTPEQIRSTFNIKNDFTPEEEAQIREENKVSWCVERGRGGGEELMTYSRLHYLCIA